jgi:CRP-like cAMP-binding protein
MTSILQHDVAPTELLRRRFGAVLGREDHELPEDVRLPDVPSYHRAAADILDGGTGEARLLVAGVAGEVRILPDGRRQILSLRLPGDFLHVHAGERVVALTKVQVVDAGAVTRGMADPSPDYLPLRRAWTAAMRVEQAMLRDQITRLGRLSAYERMAHVLLETHDRLLRVGLATLTEFNLPLTQEIIADWMGLSVVHLNRTLQALRRHQLIQTRQGSIVLPDRSKLVDVANYVSAFPGPWPSYAPPRTVRTRPRAAALA